MVCLIKKMTTIGAQIPNDSFKTHFSSLEDPRRTTKGNLVFSLEELLFVTISAVVSGCNTWVTIAGFGKLKQDWFRKFYPYKKRMPSHDALSDLFSMLDPGKFAECFINWIKDISATTESGVVAIDGKTVKGAASKGNKFPLHIVTAFCAKNRLCLGQESVTEKSNEITAIPKLLELLTLNGCIVTIDAMGCQKDIAEKICERGADYILQVKDNQKDLKMQMEDIFDSCEYRQSSATNDCGHGRIETRTCEAINVTDVILDGVAEWKHLRTLVRIKSQRTIKATEQKTIEYRYYITSLTVDTELLNKSIRSHWSIENNLHWSLDVIFKEDGQLKRKGNSAKNFNIITKTALGLLENEKTAKTSKPMKMLRAALDDDYRELVIKG